MDEPFFNAAWIPFIVSIIKQSVGYSDKSKPADLALKRRTDKLEFIGGFQITHRDILTR